MKKPAEETKVQRNYPGNNPDLMNACGLLNEYARYVELVRRFAEKMAFPEAVEQAVDYCIRNGIPEEFLSGNRAEAIAMSIFEYDEEKHLKSEREERKRFIMSLQTGHTERSCIGRINYRNGVKMTYVKR